MAFWTTLIFRLQDRAENPEQRHGQEIDRGDEPVHAPRVDHHEDDADERGEEHVDRSGNQLLDIRTNLLQFPERFAAALILEDRVGQFERVADAVRVQPGAQPLGGDVDEVVLEVLRHARHECHTHRGGQEHAHPAEELAGGVLLEAGRVLVDDVPEDQRVEQGEDLVDGGEHQREQDEPPVVFQVASQELHSGIIEDSPRPGARQPSAGLQRDERFGAEERTRTSTPLREQAPEVTRPPPRKRF